MLIQKNKISKILSQFCITYVYFNLFGLLITLFQFDHIPLAIPLGLCIIYEITSCYYFSNKQIVKMVDHALYIMAYNYVIILYYTGLQYYVFGNLFILVSFVLRTKESCSGQINHEYASIIRFLKTFYRFSALVASICISLKLNAYVSWTWPQAFWWYWMFLSALVGTCFTLFIVILSKLINEFFKQYQTLPQEYKSMAWGFYISTVSSVIAVMWITNTFEKLGINMPVGFGEVLFYSIIALNLIIFTALTRLFWEQIIEYCVFLLQSQAADIEQQRDPPSSQVQIQSPKFFVKKKAFNSILLKKMSSAFFRQITREDSYAFKGTEIMTERGPNKKILQPTEHELKQLDDDGKASESGLKCIICCDNPPNAVLMICGHGGICYKCAIEMAQKNQECFLCRQQILLIYEIRTFNEDVMKVISVTRRNY